MVLSTFVLLRNKTRGMSSPPSSGAVSATAPALEESLQSICVQLPSISTTLGLSSGWSLSGEVSCHETDRRHKSVYLMRRQAHDRMPDGLSHPPFIGPALVELIWSDVDSQDFYFPNGGFSGKQFEVLSYVSGGSRQETAEPYLAPVGALPCERDSGRVRDCCLQRKSGESATVSRPIISNGRNWKQSYKKRPYSVTDIR